MQKDHMSFKDLLLEDVKNCLLNTNEFAESITYTPKNGSPKTIKAIIVRSRLEPGGEDTGRILRNQCEVYIANDATDGVTSVDKGDDQLQFPELVGGSDITWVAIDIISKNEGLWRLLVEK